MSGVIYGTKRAYRKAVALTVEVASLTTPTTRKTRTPEESCLLDN